MSNVIRIEIPEGLQPLERGELYDLPLCDILDELGSGEIVGGGSHVVSGKIESCDVQVAVMDLDRAVPMLIKLINNAKSPVGTVIRLIEPEHRVLYKVT